MANDKKQGFLSSLFGKKRQTEDEMMAELESKQRLEARIQEILAERTQTPIPAVAQENFVAAEAAQPEQEPEVPVELFPISASVTRRKAPVPSVFLLSNVEEVPSYASNER